MNLSRSHGQGTSRIKVVLGAACGLLAIPGLVLAAEAPTLAPAGDAHADVVELTDRIAVGHTASEATATDGGAEANVVAIDGAPPVAALGGEQQGDGASSGHLVDTGEIGPADAAVAPWQAASAPGESGCRESIATAAVASADVDGVLQADVLHSDARSSYCSTATGTASAGAASSDGASVALGPDGELSADVLHNERSEDGEGTAHAARVGDLTLLDSDDVAGRCTTDVPGLVGLSCFATSGGSGEAGEAGEAVGSQLLRADAAGGEHASVGAAEASVASSGAPESAGAVGTTGGGGAAGNGLAGSPGPEATDGPSGASDAAGAANATSRAGAEGAAFLAATGGSSVEGLVIALALVALGVALLSTRRLIELQAGTRS